MKLQIILTSFLSSVLLTAGAQKKWSLQECIDNAAQNNISLKNSSLQGQMSRIVFVKSEYKLQRVNLDNILYVEGVKEYVKIVMEGDEKPIMSLMNMKSLEDFLPSPEFLRIHRLFIVHMPKVNTIDRMRLVIGENVISVSDTYKNAVQEYIDKDNWDTSAIEPNLLAYYTVDGKINSMPFNCSTPLMYYNKTAFDEAGITEIPTTVDGILEIADKLTVKNPDGSIKG